MQILGISGSLRVGSYNTALLHATGRLLPPATRMTLYPALASVPPFSEDHDVRPAREAVADFRERLAEADAILIATPEYNGSIPGQIKNALDWASRPFPDNVLRGKAAAVVGVSTGIFGAVWAQADLRKVLATAGARVLDQEIAVAEAFSLFDDDLALTDPDTTAALRRLVIDLVDSAGGTPTESRPCLHDRQGWNLRA